jgi:hypothetical protein
VPSIPSGLVEDHPGAAIAAYILGSSYRSGARVSRRARDTDALTCRAAALAAFARLNRAGKHTSDRRGHATSPCPPAYRSAIPVDASGAGGRDTVGAQAGGCSGQPEENIDVASLSALAGWTLCARVAIGGWPNGARHAADV